MTGTVAAARLQVHGRPPVVEAVPEPTAGDGEVIVEMVAAALNPVELRVRDGAVAPDAPLPRTLGIEGVGRRDGSLVVVFGDGMGLGRDGTLAERLAASASLLTPVPAGVAPEQAACCAVAGATAVRVLARADITAQDRVLVLGASGSVGQAICQLLRGRAGATFGQVRAPVREAAVGEAGAEPVLVADPNDLGRVLDGVSPTVVLDCLGGGWTEATLASARPGARIVLFGASAGGSASLDVVGFYRRSLSLRGYSGMTERPQLLRQAIAEALAAVAAGRLSFSVARTVSLDQLPEAYEALGEGVAGKLVVDLQPTSSPG